MKCKPARCPDCGGPLSTPSMMNGCMTCQDCGHPWDQEWLCRFTAALAACRRALTMAEREMRPHGIAPIRWSMPQQEALEYEQAEIDRLVRARAAIKAARTAMDNAQGRSK